MMLTCRPYGADEAVAMGLVNQRVAAGQLAGAVAELARTILANSWHSNAENKRLIYNTDGMRLAEGLDHEIMRNAGCDRDAAARRASFHNRSRDGA
ncbi:MAG: enoyl-CoA hydratase/isomerase family protein, partial [Sphingopyxis sp.]